MKAALPAVLALALALAGCLRDAPAVAEGDAAPAPDGADAAPAPDGADAGRSPRTHTQTDTMLFVDVGGERLLTSGDRTTITVREVVGAGAWLNYTVERLTGPASEVNFTVLRDGAAYASAEGSVPLSLPLPVREPAEFEYVLRPVTPLPAFAGEYRVAIAVTL